MRSLYNCRYNFKGYHENLVIFSLMNPDVRIFKYLYNNLQLFENILKKPKTEILKENIVVILKGSSANYNLYKRINKILNCCGDSSIINLIIKHHQSNLCNKNFYKKIIKK